ncbi:hypothetical protein ACVR0O_07810 [Streptococcus caviae]|uniref:hypothetical protein n=1 Tax=Streptococcus sp. 'caviae' TaxID=1915004 RepID=UPI00094BB012|nr:hypothetical protein [Streptococcus sp. 'caviae']OLN83030.1 hypothetical protein BMI76_07170 [Streptococcus sp. 'caviae']
MEVVGWYGTTKYAKNKIEKEGFRYVKYKPGISQQRYLNDLGNGIYFFLPFNNDTGEKIALVYVTSYKDRILQKKQTSPALLKCLLTLNDSQILDLDDKKIRLLIEEFAKKFKDVLDKELDSIADSGAKNRALKQKQNFGLIIELFIQLVETYRQDTKYQAVISTTYTDLPQLPRIDGKNGKEICIRKSDTITIIN